MAKPQRTEPFPSFKTCTKCKRSLPRTPEFFHRRSLKKSRDGLVAVCKDCCQKWHHEHYKNNPVVRDRVAKQRRRWAKKNPARLRELLRGEARARLKTPRGQLINLIRSGIWSAFHASGRRRKGFRLRAWERLVGWTFDELKAYLELLFQPGMTWENRGFGFGCWNIDHVLPICSFTFTVSTDPGFKKCWALSNLQPLWWVENVRKGRKVNHDPRPPLRE